MTIAQSLGKSTAQLHLTLAMPPHPQDFVPCNFDREYHQQLCNGFCRQAKEMIALLEAKINDLPKTIHIQAQKTVAQKQKLVDYFANLQNMDLQLLRIRCHGDYHLGQVIKSGKDFLILDFEGEPLRSLTERRSLQCALKDVAGMLRSFNYAVYKSLSDFALRPQSFQQLQPWADLWQQWVEATFLQSYLITTKDAAFLPQQPADVEALLNAFIIEKALYELKYELNNRPDWVYIPLQGIYRFLNAV